MTGLDGSLQLRFGNFDWQHRLAEGGWGQLRLGKNGSKEVFGKPIAQAIAWKLASNEIHVILPTVMLERRRRAFVGSGPFLGIASLLFTAPLLAGADRAREEAAGSPALLDTARGDARPSDGPAQERVRTQRKKNVPPSALAPFSVEELRLLDEGKSIKRSFDIARGDREYQAGLAYRLVRATPMDVMRALRRPDGIRRAIPYGIEARTVSESEGYSKVHILQGKKPIVGEYTVRLHWDMSDFTARFWLDPAHDHDIVDVWGAFSAQEVKPGWTLVSFRFAFNIGGVGEILSKKAQRWALSTADRMARVVEESLGTD